MLRLGDNARRGGPYTCVTGRERAIPEVTLGYKNLELHGAS